MKIKQIVVLTGQTEVADSILSGLEQLGLQICIRDHFSFEDDGKDSLIVCDPGYVETPNGSWSLRQALGNGCAVLLDGVQSTAVLEENQRERQPFVKNKERPGGVRPLQVPAERCPKAGRLAARGWSASLCGSSLREGAGSALWRELAPEGGTISERERSGPDESPKAQRSGDVLQQYGRCGNGAGDADRPVGVRWKSLFQKPLSIIVKHANPCGVAYGEAQADSYRLSFATDPKSAFGGVIGFNRTVDIDTARAIGDSFVEVLLAPGFEPEALRLLTEKKPNRRVLDIGDLLQRKNELYQGYYQKSIFGGMMLQDYDTGDLLEWKVVTKTGSH